MQLSTYSIFKGSFHSGKNKQLYFNLSIEIVFAPLLIFKNNQYEWIKDFKCNQIVTSSRAKSSSKKIQTDWKRVTWVHPVRTVLI